MSRYLRRFAVTILFLLASYSVLIASQSENTNSDNGESIIDVMGKVVDHDYVELPFTKIYLPRILLVDGDWYFYSNTQSAIDSGEFVMEDSELVRADGAGISLDMSVTSHLIYVWLGILFSLLVTLWAASRYRRGVGSETEPRGAWHNIFEVIFVFVRDDIAKEFIPVEKYVRYVPYLFSIFMAIMFMNLFGLLPWAASATADLTVTATLAAITFVITQFSGTKDHWQHVFVFPGVPAWSRIILTPVEILGLFTKPLALAIRLFANMLSGKIMIISILGLIFIFTDIFGAAIGVGSSVFWVLLTAALYFLKALVALIQAYVFALLSAVFIGMAAEEHHHHEKETSVARAQDVNI
ncbi:MAG: F0F1 ATP synthase subunit A [Balneolaceae bacterium]